MIAPTPRLVSWTGPSTRRRRFSPAISSRSSLSGFLAKSGFVMRGTLGSAGGAGQGSPGGLPPEQEVALLGPGRIAVQRHEPQHLPHHPLRRRRVDRGTACPGGRGEALLDREGVL